MKTLATDLTARDTHFEFGLNWADYSRHINEERLQTAVESVRRLVPGLAGKTFLDIGSGSGLFSAAALRLGAARVHAIDIDENAVATTRRVLASFGGEDRWTAEQASVFDLAPDAIGRFDVVYSWGVLHHSGDMWRAIGCAARMVAPGGTFAFSLYEKTPLCSLWRLEKRFYMHAPVAVQRVMRAAYKLAYQSLVALSGRKPVGGVRGVGIDHRVHDWLGGYPYESATAAQVRAHLQRFGFRPVLERGAPVHLGGIFGPGCSEYVYRHGEG